MSNGVDLLDSHGRSIRLLRILCQQKHYQPGWMGQNEGRMILRSEAMMLRPERTGLLPWKVERMCCPKGPREQSITPYEITLRPRNLMKFALLGYKLTLDQ